MNISIATAADTNPWVDCVLKITNVSNPIKNIETMYLYLTFQNKTAVGIKANAANDD
jgi:hypothetical protein